MVVGRRMQDAPPLPPVADSPRPVGECHFDHRDGTNQDAVFSFRSPQKGTLCLTGLLQDDAAESATRTH